MTSLCTCSLLLYPLLKVSHCPLVPLGHWQGYTWWRWSFWLPTNYVGKLSSYQDVLFSSFVRHMKLDAKYMCLGVRPMGIQTLKDYLFPTERFFVKLHHLPKSQSHRLFFKKKKNERDYFLSRMHVKCLTKHRLLTNDGCVMRTEQERWRKLGKEVTQMLNSFGLWFLYQ